ncbi:hypothetical protein CGLO_12313 [Colletotrichum gloeosporioides Cg-14]
MLFSL